MAIDEKVLIERLEEYKYSHLIEHDSERSEHCEENDSDYCQGIDCFLCVWNKATEIVKKLASEHNNGWISIEDRLPKEKGTYLVTAKHFGVTFARFAGQKDNMHFDANVIAWMEIPAPYKKGE